MIEHFLRRGQSIRVCQIYGTALCRYSGTLHVPTDTKPCDQEDAYELVYKFPYIAPLRALARFKIYQTTIMVAAAPLVNTAVQNEQVSREIAGLFSVGPIMALATLYYISNIIRKTVCLISIHEDMKHVRLARMTFWGNRTNVIVPIDKIIPLTEVPRSYRDAYTDVRTYDGSVKLYISLRYGGIHKLHNFQHIFGKLRE